ncbi:unnamed protein product [Xylocopa violacea]|uniref:Uncharacterized protein n=1 Tax=Xylocopa violacea TaxID=135666 RepID=A0ABP1N4N8_XYLVO
MPRAFSSNAPLQFLRLRVHVFDTRVLTDTSRSLQAPPLSISDTIAYRKERLQPIKSSLLLDIDTRLAVDTYVSFQILRLKYVRHPKSFSCTSLNRGLVREILPENLVSFRFSRINQRTVTSTTVAMQTIISCEMFPRKFNKEAIPQSRVSRSSLKISRNGARLR